MRSRAADRLSAALKLQPRNPRAVLLSAMQDLRHAKPGSPEAQRGLAELRSAAELFEQSSGTSDDAPGWGHAEAYLALGRELQTRGDHFSRFSVTRAVFAVAAIASGLAALRSTA